MWRAWRGRIFGVSRIAGRVMLAFRLCPSCAADLSGMTAGGDGCTVCPRCAAAWAVPAGPLEPAAPRGVTRP